MTIFFVVLPVYIILILLAWLLPEKWQIFPVSLATFFLLGFISPLSLLILTITSLTSYYVLNSNRSQPAATLVVIFIVSCFLLLLKLQLVFNFNITKNALLPIGVSYYSFRQIHYAIEAYKKRLPKHTLLDYINYIFFLPTFIIGPINVFQPFLKDLRKRRWDNLVFSQGLERILYGSAKIIVIGNYLLTFKLTNFCTSIASKYLWFSTYLQAFKFTANAYMQFAGYSDIAIGLSMLLGFKISENFHYPFFSKNISEFWKRWHISLSSWCRNYVFYPFLGITRNARISILISMVILGIWHEISFRYFIWGMLHALALNIWNKYETTNFHKKFTNYPLLQQLSGMIITINFVMLSFILISQSSLKQSTEIYKILLFLK